jgi:hypothetical protein
MGQRIIISESDRKHIKKLYESAPPPSESILVANKNPFKYDEYIDARRRYTKDLKDGDMFYQLNVNTYYRIQRKFETNFMNDLMGKTIRNTSRDLIYEFINFKFDYETFVTVRIDGEREPSKVKFRFIYQNSEPSKIQFKESLLSDEFDFPQLNDMFIKKYNEIVKPQLQLNNIPDEYFEIRQIKRQQTDF